MYKSVGGRDRKIAAYEPGEYFGEVPLMLGAPAIASLRAREPSRVFDWSGKISWSWWDTAVC